MNNYTTLTNYIPNFSFITVLFLRISSDIKSGHWDLMSKCILYFFIAKRHIHLSQIKLVNKIQTVDRNIIYDWTYFSQQI